MSEGEENGWTDKEKQSVNVCVCVRERERRRGRLQSQTNSASRHLIKCPLSLYFEKWTLVPPSWLAFHENWDKVGSKSLFRQPSKFAKQRCLYEQLVLLGYGVKAVAGGLASCGPFSHLLSRCTSCSSPGNKVIG